MDDPAAGKTTITMPTGGATITAVFEKKDYGTWHDEGFKTDSDGCSLSSGKGTGIALPFILLFLIVGLGRFQRRSNEA